MFIPFQLVPIFLLSAAEVEPVGLSAEVFDKSEPHRLCDRVFLVIEWRMAIDVVIALFDHLQGDISEKYLEDAFFVKPLASFGCVTAPARITA